MSKMIYINTNNTVNSTANNLMGNTFMNTSGLLASSQKFCGCMDLLTKASIPQCLCIQELPDGIGDTGTLTISCETSKEIATTHETETDMSLVQLKDDALVERITLRLCHHQLARVTQLMWSERVAIFSLRADELANRSMVSA